MRTHTPHFGVRTITPPDATPNVGMLRMWYINNFSSVTFNYASIIDWGLGHLGRGHYGRGHLGRGHYGRGHFGRGHLGRGHFGPLI